MIGTNSIGEMEQTSTEEEIIHKKLNHVKTLLQEEELQLSDESLVEQIGSLLEYILRDNWWEVAGRISRSKTLFGTGYKVRYDLVKNNTDIRTVKGKGKLYLDKLYGYYQVCL